MNFYSISFILLLITLYDGLSIGLTFYQKYFIKEFPYPLSIVIGHLALKFLYATVIRLILALMKPKKEKSFVIDKNMYWKTIFPTGITSGLDIGLSNWSFEFITVSLYTMSKSSCIIFIFIFSVILGLDYLKFSNCFSVTLIATGLFLFTYHSTQFNAKGFSLVMIAAMVGGMRWTLAQLVTQHHKHAIKNPLDVIFYVQPWMLLILMPLAFIFEEPLYATLFNTNNPLYSHFILVKIFIGSLIAFGMEVFEYILVSHTSGLTLAISGIIKEIITLYLASTYNGDQFSTINMIGLVLCLMGIILHVIFKFVANETNTKSRWKNCLYKLRYCPRDLIIKPQEGSVLNGEAIYLQKQPKTPIFTNAKNKVSIKNVVDNGNIESLNEYDDHICYDSDVETSFEYDKLLPENVNDAKNNGYNIQPKSINDICYQSLDSDDEIIHYSKRGDGAKTIDMTKSFNPLKNIFGKMFYKNNVFKYEHIDKSKPNTKNKSNLPLNISNDNKGTFKPKILHNYKTMIDQKIQALKNDISSDRVIEQNNNDGDILFDCEKTNTLAVKTDDPNYSLVKKRHGSYNEEFRDGQSDSIIGIVSNTTTLNGDNLYLTNLT